MTNDGMAIITTTTMRVNRSVSESGRSAANTPLAAVSAIAMRIAVMASPMVVPSRGPI